MNSISNTLNKAADRLEVDGWWRSGVEECGDSATCAALAIVDAAGDHLPAKRAAWVALSSHLDSDASTDANSALGSIYRWNDAPCRTAEEVIETLRAAAVIAAAREEATAAEADVTVTA